MPKYAGPINLTPTPQVCVFLPEGRPILVAQWPLVCICLPEAITDKFTEYFCLMDSSNENLNTNNLQR